MIKKKLETHTKESFEGKDFLLSLFCTNLILTLLGKYHFFIENYKPFTYTWLYNLFYFNTTSPEDDAVIVLAKTIVFPSLTEVLLPLISVICLVLVLENFTSYLNFFLTH